MPTLTKRQVEKFDFDRQLGEIWIALKALGGTTINNTLTFEAETQSQQRAELWQAIKEIAVGGDVLLAGDNHFTGNNTFGHGLLPGQIVVREGSASGTNVTGFKAPSILAGDVVYQLPATSGTPGQLLSWNAGNILTWKTSGGNVTPLDLGVHFWLDASSLKGLGYVDGNEMATMVESSVNGATVTKIIGTIYYRTDQKEGPCLRFDGNCYARAVGVMNASFVKDITVITLARRTGAPAAILGSETAASLFVFGHFRDSVLGYFGGAGGISKANGQAEGTPMCDVWRYNGATIQSRSQMLNTESIAQTVVMGAIGNLDIGTFGSTVDFNHNFVGDIFEIMVFNYCLTDAQVLQMEAYLRKKWNVLNRPIQIFVGDSIYTNIGGINTITAPGKAADSLYGQGYQYDTAVISHPGWKITNAEASFGTQIDDLLSDARSRGVKTSLSFELCVNDLFSSNDTAATMWGNTKTFMLKRRAAGLDDGLIHTAPSIQAAGTLRTDGFNGGANSLISARTAYTAQVLAHYTECATGVVDVDADANLGNQTINEGVWDGTYFIDGIHPTETGMTALGLLDANAIRAARASIIIPSIDGTTIWKITMNNDGTPGFMQL